jgi:uncharacterized RDD family membrane protein YckC
MTTPWFDPNAWAWLPGTLFGCLAGAWGACAGMLAPRGKARGFVVGFGITLIVAAVIFLVAAIVAYFGGQPYGIWFGLGLPGLQGLILLPALLPLVLIRYRQAEERKMAARDLQV